MRNSVRAIPQPLYSESYVRPYCMAVLSINIDGSSYKASFDKPERARLRPAKFLCLARSANKLILGCSGAFLSRLGNGPYGASYGSLWGLIGATEWTYYVN